jgi:hypothetical protein
VIRFSAALVAVAIGVLIGGIATSKLLLVYIAIVVSAVALVALAVGVMLRREELFGEGQGLKGQELAPAAAGAGPVLQARTGESAGESQHKVPAGAHVAPPPPFQGAAGGYAAFGGTAQAASSSAGAGSSAARTAAAGPGRPAEPVPPWDASAARGPRSSPTPDWMHSGQDERAASAAGGAGGRAPSAWQDTKSAGTQGGRAGGRGVPDADAQPAEKAPRSWAAPSSPPVSADAPAVKPGAGSGSAAPSWFDRLGGQAGAPPTVAAPTVASPPVSGATGAGDAASGDAGAGDEDDDWPTRYSWLDDETDEGGEAAETVATPVVGAEPEGKSPVPAGTAAGTGPADVATGTTADAGASAAETVATPTKDAGTADAADGADGDPANAAAAEEPDADIIAFPGPGEPGPGSDPDPDADPDNGHDGLAGESGADDAAEAGRAAAASESGSEPPVTAEVDTAPGTDLVTVVPGVPRYHRTDCVLIRFMPEGDVQKQSVAAARDAGCTPCAACQPEG